MCIVHVHSFHLPVNMCTMSANMLAEFACSVEGSIDLHKFDNVVHQHVGQHVRHAVQCEGTLREAPRLDVIHIPILWMPCQKLTLGNHNWCSSHSHYFIIIIIIILVWPK